MIINVELKTDIRIKSKKEIKKLMNLIEAFAEVVGDDFKTCHKWKIDIYDSKRVIDKQINEIVFN